MEDTHYVYQSWYQWFWPYRPLVFRASLNFPEIEVVGINDLCPADYLAYMLKYDTMHGQFNGTVEATENSIIVNGKETPSLQSATPLICPGASSALSMLSSPPACS